jgi:hypothetical protein
VLLPLPIRGVIPLLVVVSSNRTADHATDKKVKTQIHETKLINQIYLRILSSRTSYAHILIGTSSNRIKIKNSYRRGGNLD